MRKSKEFDDQIRDALHNRVDRIQADKNGFHALSTRLSRGERRKEAALRIAGQFFQSAKKPAAAACCAVLALVLVCSVNPSFRVWADGNIQKMSNMIYVVIKGDDNKYDSVRVPAQYTDNGNSVVVTVDDSQLEFKYKAPAALDGGYQGEEQTSDTAEAGRTVSKYYRNGDSQLILNITQEKWMMDSAKTGGDNTERLDMEGLEAYYYESPDPIYPLIQDKDGLWTFDLTQPPTEIKTNHQVAWKYKGVSYQVSDLGEASEDIVKKAAESAVRYQLDK